MIAGLSWSDLGWSKLITFGGKPMGVLTCYENECNKTPMFKIPMLKNPNNKYKNVTKSNKKTKHLAMALP